METAAPGADETARFCQSSVRREHAVTCRSCDFRNEHRSALHEGKQHFHFAHSFNTADRLFANNSKDNLWTVNCLSFRFPAAEPPATKKTTTSAPSTSISAPVTASGLRFLMPTGAPSAPCARRTRSTTCTAPGGPFWTTCTRLTSPFTG